MLFDIYSRLGSLITFLIAVAGFVISVCVCIKDIVVNRRSLQLDIVGLCAFQSSLAAIVSIANRSRLPITVTGITLMAGSREIPCLTVPKQIIQVDHRRNGIIYKSDVKMTSDFPAVLQGLGGRSLYLLFEELPDTSQIASTGVTLRVFSNRGRPVEKRFQHVQVHPDLKTLFQL